MVVRRGYRRPPSLHDDRLRDAPVGHFFDVMTNGFGAMPDYAAQIKRARSLGDRRLHPRAAAERARDARRRAGRRRGEPDAVTWLLTQTADAAIPELADLQRQLLHRRRRRRRGRRSSGSVLNPTQFFQSYLMAYMLVPRRHARLPRARHDPSAVGRRVGRRHPPADRRGVARAAGDDAAVPADRVRHAPSLRVDARRTSSRRRGPAAQAART